jgi:hypothetical protein
MGILMLKRKPIDIIAAIPGMIALWEEIIISINTAMNNIFTRASIAVRKLSFWAK